MVPPPAWPYLRMGPTTATTVTWGAPPFQHAWSFRRRHKVHSHHVAHFGGWRQLPRCNMENSQQQRCASDAEKQQAEAKARQALDDAKAAGEALVKEAVKNARKRCLMTRLAR